MKPQTAAATPVAASIQSVILTYGLNAHWDETHGRVFIEDDIGVWTVLLSPEQAHALGVQLAEAAIEGGAGP